MIAPPMMVSACVPRSLATAEPSVRRVCAVTNLTSKILPGIISTWFKKPRSAGTSAHRAKEGNCLKESDGIFVVEGTVAGPGPSVLAKGVPGGQGGQHVLDD